MKQQSNQLSGVDFSSLCLVGLDNFNTDVLAEDRPVLLLCMPRDKSLYNQVSEIEKLHHDYQNALKICLLKEDFLGVFMDKYNVRGTPTFLIFSAGSECERLLGQVSHKELKRFVTQTLPNLEPTKS